MVEKAQAEQKKVEESETKKVKWKGKEWISVLAPPAFGEVRIGEIAATEPVSVVGRNIEADGSEITGSTAKSHIKLYFKIKSVEGNIARTSFHSLYVARDFLARFVRKKVKKVECIVDEYTKDGWKLHVKGLAIMSNTYMEIGHKIRIQMAAVLKDAIKNSTTEDFVKAVMDGEIQKSIRKTCLKIYPLKVSEIAKIEVIKSA